jgi:hypothetical protein
VSRKIDGPPTRITVTIISTVAASSRAYEINKRGLLAGPAALCCGRVAVTCVGSYFLDVAFFRCLNFGPGAVCA